MFPPVSPSLSLSLRLLLYEEIMWEILISLYLKKEFIKESLLFIVLYVHSKWIVSKYKMCLFVVSVILYNFSIQKPFQNSALNFAKEI